MALSCVIINRLTSNTVFGVAAIYSCRSANETKIVGWTRFDSVKWAVNEKLRSPSSGAIVRMQQNTLFLFTEEETFWMPMMLRSGCWGCQSSYFWFMLDQQCQPKWQSKYCKYFKDEIFNWHIYTKLTMICTRFINVYWPGIEVMTVQFLHIIGLIDCQHFQRLLPLSVSVIPGS